MILQFIKQRVNKEFISRWWPYAALTDSNCLYEYWRSFVIPFNLCCELFIPVVQREPFFPFQSTIIQFYQHRIVPHVINAWVESINIAFKGLFRSGDSQIASVNKRLPFDGDVLLVRPLCKGFCCGSTSSLDSSECNFSMICPKLLDIVIRSSKCSFSMICPKLLDILIRL